MRYYVFRVDHEVSSSNNLDEAIDWMVEAIVKEGIETIVSRYGVYDRWTDLEVANPTRLYGKSRVEVLDICIEGIDYRYLPRIYRPIYRRQL